MTNLTPQEVKQAELTFAVDYIIDGATKKIETAQGIIEAESKRLTSAIANNRSIYSYVSTIERKREEMLVYGEMMALLDKLNAGTVEEKAVALIKFMDKQLGNLTWKMFGTHSTNRIEQGILDTRAEVRAEVLQSLQQDVSEIKRLTS